MAQSPVDSIGPKKDVSFIILISAGVVLLLLVVLMVGFRFGANISRSTQNNSDSTSLSDVVADRKIRVASVGQNWFEGNDFSTGTLVRVEILPGSAIFVVSGETVRDGSFVDIQPGLLVNVGQTRGDINSTVLQTTNIVVYEN